MRTSLQPDCPPPGESGLKPSLHAAGAGAAISIYALWNARNLLSAWLHSPYDRCGSLAFLLWVAPIVCLWMSRRLPDHRGQVTPAAFAIALGVSFAGVIADLSALKYLGLAIALAGFLPIQPATYVWLACAAAWMPGAGWALSSDGAILVNALRAAAGLFAALLTPLFLQNEIDEPGKTTATRISGSCRESSRTSNAFAAPRGP